MPNKPGTPCGRQGCPEVSNGWLCPKHQAEYDKVAKRVVDKYRGSAAKRGYDRKWRARRLGYLQANPLCVRCREKGLLVSATVVDHITPHGGDYVLMWDRENWQALCKPCHDAKTAREDGAFGNRRRAQRAL